MAAAAIPELAADEALEAALLTLELALLAAELPEAEAALVKEAMMEEPDVPLCEALAEAIAELKLDDRELLAEASEETMLLLTEERWEEADEAEPAALVVVSAAETVVGMGAALLVEAPVRV